MKKFLSFLIALTGCLVILPAHALTPASPNLLPKPAAAPEIDPGSATAALTLLAGGLAVLRTRRRR